MDPHVVFARDATAFAHDTVDSGDDASVDMDTDEGGTGNIESEDEEEGFSVVGADTSVNNHNSTSDDDSAITISNDSASDNNSDITVTDNEDNDDNDFFSIGETFNDNDGVQPTMTLPSSNNHNRPTLHITTNPAMPTTAISSSLIVEDGLDSDWGFSSIEDPEFIQWLGMPLTIHLDPAMGMVMTNGNHT